MSPNPYQSPAALQERSSALGKVLRWFRGVPSAYRFRNGGDLLCNGIQFWIESNDPQTLFAASPSATIDQERIELVIDEVIETIPMLLTDYPSLHRKLMERRLVVGIIETYGNSRQELKHRAETNLAIAEILRGELDKRQLDETMSSD